MSSPNVLDSIPAFSEVQTALKDLKNNKVAGPDGISWETFKYGGYLLLQHLYMFIWETGSHPYQWKNANIIPPCIHLSEMHLAFRAKIKWMVDLTKLLM